MRVDKQRCITASFIESAYLISKFAEFYALPGKSAYNERQPLWSKSCVNNAYLLGCLNFVCQKCVYSESCGKFVSFLLLHRVYYWTSSELDMAKVHISICELLPEYESVQLYAFNGKAAYLATFPLCLFVFQFVDN